MQRAVQESFDHVLAQAREPVEEMGDHLIVQATGAVEEASERLVARATAAAQEMTDNRDSYRDRVEHRGTERTGSARGNTRSRLELRARLSDR